MISRYLPQKYKEACVFQATNVEHTVDSSGWTSNINGVMRSTLGYVFDDTETVDEETKEQLENYKGQVFAKMKKYNTVNVKPPPSKSPDTTGKGRKDSIKRRRYRIVSERANRFTHKGRLDDYVDTNTVAECEPKNVISFSDFKAMQNKDA